MRNRKFTECIDLVGTACKPFVGVKNYVSTGAVDVDHINESDVETVDYEGRPSRANLEVCSGDVLFAKMQGTKKTLMIDSELEENIYSTGFCAVRAKKGVLTQRCLFHLLNSSMFLLQKDKHCSGATQKAITNAGLAKIAISVPSIEEQETVVRQLDIIAGIVAKRKQELSALDDLIKARFVEMFGDVIDNPFGFDKKMLKETCTIITGNTPSRLVSEYYGDGVEWIKTDNIVEGQIKPSQAIECLTDKGVKVGRTVDKGAILMACIAGSVASIGRVCIADRKVAFNQQINAVVPKAYDSLFLYVMLQQSKNYLVEEINMALKGILSKSKLESKVFFVPPMDRQKEFTAFVTQCEKSKAVVQKALDEAQLLFDSLMQKYFG